MVQVCAGSCRRNLHAAGPPRPYPVRPTQPAQPAQAVRRGGKLTVWRSYEADGRSSGRSERLLPPYPSHRNGLPVEELNRLYSWLSKTVEDSASITWDSRSSARSAGDASCVCSRGACPRALRCWRWRRARAGSPESYRNMATPPRRSIWSARPTSSATSINGSTWASAPIPSTRWWLWRLIEHVDCLEALRSICKIGGLIMLSSPHPHWDWVMKILESAHLNQKRTSAHDNLTDFNDIDLPAVVRQRPMFVHQVAILRNEG